MSESKRGGRRPGAGRKAGSKNKATIAREIFAAVDDYKGPPPLARMLEAMNDAYARGDLREAFSMAEKCAPYFHHKLAAQSITVAAGDDPAPPRAVVVYLPDNGRGDLH